MRVHSCEMYLLSPYPGHPTILVKPLLLRDGCRNWWRIRAQRNQLNSNEEDLETKGFWLSLIRRPLIAVHTGYVPRKSISEEKRDRSRNVSILSCACLWKSLREKERREEGQKTEENERRVLTISGCGRLWGQIIGLRPITRWRRRYIEESGCRRVPRIVLAAKNKIPPGSGDYVPKKEESGETLALVCAGGGWDEEERWDEPRMVRWYGRREKKRGHTGVGGRGREGGGEEAKRKRVRKEGPPRGGSCAGASVNEVVGWGRLQVEPTCVWSIHSDCCRTG